MCLQLRICVLYRHKQLQKLRLSETVLGAIQINGKLCDSLRAVALLEAVKVSIDEVCESLIVCLLHHHHVALFCAQIKVTVRSLEAFTLHWTELQ